MEFYEKSLWSHISFSCTSELVRARQLSFFDLKPSPATIWNLLRLDKREKSLSAKKLAIVKTGFRGSQLLSHSPYATNQILGFCITDYKPITSLNAGQPMHKKFSCSRKASVEQFEQNPNVSKSKDESARFGFI